MHLSIAAVRGIVRKMKWSTKLCKRDIDGHIVINVISTAITAGNFEFIGLTRTQCRDDFTGRYFLGGLGNAADDG